MIASDPKEDREMEEGMMDGKVDFCRPRRWYLSWAFTDVSKDDEGILDRGSRIQRHRGLKENIR